MAAQRFHIPARPPNRLSLSRPQFAYAVLKIGGGAGAGVWLVLRHGKTGELNPSVVQHRCAVLAAG
jgi:hypothetical protein